MCAARHALHDQNLEKEAHQISPSLVNLPGDCQLPKSHCKVSLCARMLQASQNAEAQAGIEFATLPSGPFHTSSSGRCKAVSFQVHLV